MDRTYFERLHSEETRRSSWRMLDEALQKRSRRSKLVRLRHGFGRALISVGTRLADENRESTAAIMTTQACQ